jgi:hypothetical protein
VTTTTVQTSYGKVNVKQHEHGALTLEGLESDPAPLPTYRREAAACGSFACAGCYDVGDGIQFHPPRSGYQQARLIAMDE